MCGIVGKVYREHGRPVASELIERMKQCIVHRGPDEDGTHLHAPCAFGFRRLAIIDLSTGQQPILNEDGTKVIVFNGEIYNFPELRDQLIAAGHVFRTRSDTETILHGYEEWGSGVTRRLRGMFAFAIYDHAAHTLFLARDRTGKKPLYYAHTGAGTAAEAILFASEMKALLADPAVPREVDPAALSHYLTHQYVPHPWSIFRGIRKLPPAHQMTWKGGDPAPERYWHLDYEPKVSITETDAARELLERLDEAVRIRLMSEVPLGCFLSGGIDSSAIVMMMRRHIAGSLKTFSIGFREDEYNELPYAREVARKYETDHEEFIVEPDAIGAIGRLAWHYDEPFADPSALPTYYLSEMTRRFVTVALNGDGGDESFAGYRRYLGHQNLDRLLAIPRWLRAASAPVAGALWSLFPESALFEKLGYGLKVSLAPQEEIYVQLMIMFREHQKAELLTGEYREALNEREADSELLTLDALNAVPGRALVDKFMAADIAYYLPGALLPKVDKATMAVSLEGRSPFLDHPLMEWAASLPAELKLKNGRLKSLLKTALEPEFGAAFLDRPKQGFGVPIDHWFRGPLLPWLREMLLSERALARGFFRREPIERLVQQHAAGTQNHQYRLWVLVMLEAWCRTFLDQSDPTAGPIDLHPH